MNILFVLVNPIDILMGAGFTGVHIYSDPSATGTFTTLLATVPLVAEQESITYVDLAGTSSTWYKTAYYGATPGEDTKSAAFQASTQSSYATVLELRRQSDKRLNIDDLNIQIALDAAKYAIDNYTNRPQGFVANGLPSAKLYAAEHPSYLMIDECVSVTSLEVKASPTDTTYVTWTTGQWIACCGDPDYPDYNSQPYDLLVMSATGIQQLFTGFNPYVWRDSTIQKESFYRRQPNVRVTATWGFSTAVPAAVKLATIAQATRWLKRGEAGWADTLASQDFGAMQFRKALDPDIQMMLVNARLCKPATGRG